MRRGVEMRPAALLAVVFGLLTTATAASAAPPVDCTKVHGRRTVAIHLSAPAEPKASAVTVRLQYPPAFAVPGDGAAASVRDRVHTKLTNTTVAANDGEQGLRVVLARATGIPSGEVATVELDACTEPAATASEIPCEVEGAGSSTGAVTGVTCSIHSQPEAR